MWDNLSSLIPSLSNKVPDESDIVMTFAPRWIHFSAAYCATFPEPEIATDFPFIDLPS